MDGLYDFLFEGEGGGGGGLVEKYTANTTTLISTVHTTTVPCS